jgi:hypothetical protein
VVDSESEVSRNFTWAVLGMEDGNFWHLGGVTRWNSQILIHTWTFLAIIFVASQLSLCLFWISLWLRISVYNILASKIAQASKNSDSNAQHFLSDLLIHSWFHYMLFALPCYQFPYTVMNRTWYLYLRIHNSLHCPPTMFIGIFSYIPRRLEICGVYVNSSIRKVKRQWTVFMVRKQLHLDRLISETESESPN